MKRGLVLGLWVIACRPSVTHEVPEAAENAPAASSAPATTLPNSAESNDPPVPVAPSLTATAADAQALGALLSEEVLDEPTYECTLSHGLVVADRGRADVLECKTEAVQLDEVAYLVLRLPDDDPRFEALATGYEVPGEGCSYTLSTPTFDGSTLRMTVTETTTTYGNTGDPDEDPDESSEVMSTVLRCGLPDDGCERSVAVD